MTMGMYRDGDTEEDFAYVRNYRNMIQGELSEMFPCELQVHSSSAFLIRGELQAWPDLSGRKYTVRHCAAFVPAFAGRNTDRQSRSASG